MTTAEKFEMLSPEGKRDCIETAEHFPNEWDQIVEYYWSIETTPPSGWFRWWDD